MIRLLVEGLVWLAILGFAVGMFWLGVKAFDTFWRGMAGPPGPTGTAIRRIRKRHPSRRKR